MMAEHEVGAQINREDSMKSVITNVKNIFWLYKAYWKYGKKLIILSLIFWLLVYPFAQLISVYLPSAIDTPVSAHV